MKTVIYSIIAIMVVSIFASALRIKQGTNQTFILQSTENSVSSQVLTQSARIISGRLADFNSEKYNVKVIPEKSQLYVSLQGKWDLNSVKSLLMQKGAFGIYETLDSSIISDILSENKVLASLLNSDAGNFKYGKMGCASIEEVEHANETLHFASTMDNCLLLWGYSSGDSMACLFGLNQENNSGALINSSEIESCKITRDNSSDNYSLEIKFNTSASEKWSLATRRNINKTLAIVLDDAVIYYPVVKSQMNQGTCALSGNFSQSELKLFAAFINNGTLPVSFKLVK